MDKNQIKKILIIRLSAIGDTIHTLPLVNSIKEQLPDCQIDWIVEDKAEVFVKNAQSINNCIVLPKKKWKKNPNKFQNIKEFFGIIKQLRKEKYDVAIDVQELFKSGIILGLCGAKTRISSTHAREFSQIFANKIVKMPYKLFNVNYHILKINEHFLEVLNLTKTSYKFLLNDFSEDVVQKAKSFLENTDKSLPIFVFAPATTWYNKHWDVENWAGLTKIYSNKANIIFTGTDKDKNYVDEIIKKANVEKNIINLTGKTNLKELYELIKNSDLVISPDSGTAHIAWASEHPYVITIFTSTSKNRTGPIGEKCITISSDLECQPCMKKKCNLKKDKNLCMKSLNYQEVSSIIDKLFFE